MGGSRRKYKKSRTKVQVGLPKKKPGIFKPAFSLPPKLVAAVGSDSKWDDEGSVITNYKSFGVVSNPNFRSALYRTPHTVECEALNLPPAEVEGEDRFAVLDDSGSDLEEDDLKTALSKKRKDGKSAPLKPLTAIQKIHIGKLVEEYGDNYQSMFMDVKLNKMQHSVATLEKLCKRYHMHKDRNPLILPS